MLENYKTPEIPGQNNGSNSVKSAEQNAAVVTPAVSDVCRYLPGSRWSHQETKALLQIRAEMDVEFRNSGLKLVLWEDISRRMAELGYHRSGKKCREKFENVYKYNKRLKYTPCARSNNKAYRFSDQLEVLDHRENLPQPSDKKQIGTAMKDTAIAATPIAYNSHSASQNLMPLSANFGSSPITNSTSIPSSSGSESSGNESKKRKWTDCFDRLVKSVLEKQEDLHNQLLEAVDRCERARLAREEAWKMQELDRIKRQQELLMQEKSLSATKDAAVLAFLKTISDQGQFLGTSEGLKKNPGQEVSVVCRKENDDRGELEENPGQELSFVCRKEKDDRGELEENPGHELSFVCRKEKDDRGELEENPGQELSVVCRKEKDDRGNFSSRWPKEEIEALIRVKTCMETEGQKVGTLWEEISMAMKSMGYNRSAKRCKEKWENMNKYYRRVKECNKPRPFGSKTCPYFNLLDSLYNRDTKRLDNSSDTSGSTLDSVRPEELLLHMMNHQHPGQQQLEQAVFQQQDSELITNLDSSQNGCRSSEDGSDKYAEDKEADYRMIGNDSVHVNGMVSGHVACHE